MIFAYKSIQSNKKPGADERRRMDTGIRRNKTDSV